MLSIALRQNLWWKMSWRSFRCKASVNCSRTTQTSTLSRKLAAKFRKNNYFLKSLWTSLRSRRKVQQEQEISWSGDEGPLSAWTWRRTTSSNSVWSHRMLEMSFCQVDKWPSILNKKAVPGSLLSLSKLPCHWQPKMTRYSSKSMKPWKAHPRRQTGTKYPTKVLFKAATQVWPRWGTSIVEYPLWIKLYLPVKGLRQDRSWLKTVSQTSPHSCTNASCKSDGWRKAQKWS